MLLQAGLVQRRRLRGRGRIAVEILRVGRECAAAEGGFQHLRHRRREDVRVIAVALVEPFRPVLHSLLKGGRGVANRLDLLHGRNDAGLIVVHMLTDDPEQGRNALREALRLCVGNMGMRVA